MQFANPATGFNQTDYVGLNQDFITVGDNTGAGNGADAPDWASGWARFE